jgi:hypothetical protein
MKFIGTVLVTSLLLSSLAQAECVLTVTNKHTKKVQTVRLEPLDADETGFLLSGSADEFAASYRANIFAKTETFMIADADAVMSSTTIVMGSNPAMKLELSRNKVFAALECK